MRGYTTTVFDMVKEALEQISLAIYPWRKCEDALGGGIGIVSFVHKQRTARFDAFNETFGLRAIGNLPPIRQRLTGQPSVITIAWILLVRLSRERPMQPSSASPFSCGFVLVNMNTGAIDHHDVAVISLRDSLKQPIPDTGTTPANKPVVASRCNTVTLRYFGPS